MSNVTFDIGSDSTWVGARSFSVWVYEDLACKPSRHGELMVLRKFADKQEVAGPLPVPGNAPLIFAVDLWQSQFGKESTCSVTASFVPDSGKTYAIRFRTVNQAQSCSMQITDQSGALVQHLAPALSCRTFHGSKTKNGGGGVRSVPIIVPIPR